MLLPSASKPIIASPALPDTVFRAICVFWSSRSLSLPGLGVRPRLSSILPLSPPKILCLRSRCR